MVKLKRIKKKTVKKLAIENSEQERAKVGLRVTPVKPIGKVYHSIAGAEYDLMICLDKNPGVCMTALAEVAGKTKESVGNPVIRLKNKGYIKTISIKNREKSLELTDLGEEALVLYESGNFTTGKMMIANL